MYFSVVILPVMEARMKGWRVSEVRRLLLFFLIVFGVHVFCSSCQTTLRTAGEEHQALEAFRTTLTNSRQELPNWYNNDDPCTSQWTGVICLSSDYPDSLKNSNFLHVTELRLLRRNLTGTLAPELGNLKALNVLDVMWNQMNGSIPATFGGLTNLTLLLLSGNRFSGNLPESLGDLKNLLRVQIDENNISGPLPQSFTNLSSVQHLHMNNNSISGSIPEGFGGIAELAHLLLDNNNLTGTLPLDISKSKSIEIIQLDNNGFDDGTIIPEEYTQILSLQKLSLRNCNLIGGIPDDWSKSEALRVVDLSHNQLNGSIPSNFPSEMTAIDLSHNNFNGTIPPGLGTLANLSFLLLSNNHFSGALPKELDSANILNNAAPDYSRNTSFPKGIFDFQKNNLTLDGPQLYFFNRIPLARARILFRGNPEICPDNQMANNSVICELTDMKTLFDVGFVVNSSSNLGSKCGAGKCRLPYRLVPNAHSRGCECAVPVIVWFRLKSPGFRVFDLVFSEFLSFISSRLILSEDQVDVFDYTTEWNSRLSMHLHLFPYSGYRFNDSEVTRLNSSFHKFEFEDNPTFGPWELLDFPSSLENGLNSKFLSRGAIAGIAVGVVAAAGLVLMAVWFLVRKRRHKSRRSSRKPIHRRLLSRFKTSGLQEWTWEEMEQFTNRFSDSNVLGSGGFGKVYLGVLPDGSKVAIKRAGIAAAGSNKQFETEIDLLSRVHHRNLVSLKGICHDEESGDQFLVYEFMENGTVEDHLPPVSTTPLNFPTRLRVALGAAKGINYLHTEANPPIYHRDIKASNILLDGRFQAKVADFGVGKNAPQPEDEGGVGGGVETVVKGTPGYVDPEYYLTHTLTDKSDVYSFGVFLMVLLTGKQAITNGKNIVRHMKVAEEAGMLWSTVDSYMAGQCPAHIAEAWARLTLRCTAPDPNDRPNMTEVVKELEILYKELGINRSQIHSTPSTWTSDTSTFTPTSSSDERTRSSASAASTTPVTTKDLTSDDIFII